MEDKPTIDLLDYFAAHALSGYVRGGLSYDSRGKECHEVATACYDIALAMYKVRQEILDTVDNEMAIDSEGKLRPK